MKFKSLHTRLVTIFGLCFFVTIGVLITYSVISSRRTEIFVERSSKEFATSAAKDMLLEKARAIGFHIEVELEVALDAARTLAEVFSGIKDPQVNLEIDRNQLNGILRSVLERNKSFLGTYTLWEPNALDGLDNLHIREEGHDQAGRFIPYWSRNEQGEIQLETLVDYENQEKDENGIRKGEYYLLPREQKKECAIDPYPYPVQGQIVWMTSLVVPIMVNDTFYGIAGIDMRLDFIQALIERTNKEFYGGAGRIGIISHNGILAASSSHPELVGKHLKYWMPEDWQEDAELIRSGKEEVALAGGNLEIIVPLKIGRTDMPWSVIIEIPEETVLAEVQALVNGVRTRGRQILVRRIGVGAGIVFVALLTIWFVSKSLTRPLKIAAAVAEQVSEGNLDVEFAVTSRDEVGQVLLSMKKMINYIRDVAAIAEKISKENLQVQVTPKSAQDTLNHSLQRMVINLQTMMQNISISMKKIQKQNWLKDGANQLNSGLLEQTTLQEACQKAVSFVARYVNAGRGVLYTYDAEHSLLNLTGSFAIAKREQHHKIFRLGEGVIGQVALERSPIFLKHPKRTDSIISTGTISETPLNTYTFPLVYDNNLYGVIELASFEPLNSTKQDFLNEANQVIATVIFSTLQRERVQKLLQLSQQTMEEVDKARKEAKKQAEETHKANTRLEEQQQQLQQQNEEMKQINADLEGQQRQLQQQSEELRQQNESLNQTKKELELTSKYRVTFMENMSHELRASLNSIILLSKLLSKNKKNTFEKSDVQRLLAINKAGEDLLRLINDIVALSRIESGKVPVKITQFSMSTFLENIKQEFQPLAEEKGVKFIIQNTLNTSIKTDQEILAQIHRNLLSHAFISTHKGSVTLMTSSSRTPKETIRFLVQDTGTGISPERQQRLFQVLSATSISKESSGADSGLILARRYANLLGGNLTVHSEPGKGSTFTLEIAAELKKSMNVESEKHDITEPTTTAPEVSDTTTPHPVTIAETMEHDKTCCNIEAVGYYQTQIDEPDIQHGIEKAITASAKIQKHLLLVGDNEGQRNAIKALIRNNHEVNITEVSSLQDAIKEIKNERYDTAILTLSLEDGNSDEIYHYIKKHNIFLPIIIYTEHEFTEQEEDQIRQYTDSIPIKTALTYEHLLHEVSNFLYEKPYKQNSSTEHKNRLEGKKLLVVDDDIKNTFVLAAILENHGASTLDAQNGKAALKILRQERDIDLILMDIMMPIMDGYTTIQEIRKDATLKHLPIIVLTAKTLNEERQKCIQAGANDYLAKPVDYDELIRLVKQWVRKNRKNLSQHGDKYSI